MCGTVGFEVRYYRYYDSDTKKINFAGMFEDLNVII